MDELQRWLARNPHGETIKLVSLMIGLPLLVWCIGRLLFWLFGVNPQIVPGGYW